MFQVLQLTALIVPGPSTPGEKFMISVDRIAAPDRGRRGVLLCVQDYALSSYFTRKSFFSESGLTMMSESVATADNITSSSVYAPWSHAETVSAGRVVTALRVF